MRTQCRRQSQSNVTATEYQHCRNGPDILNKHTGQRYPDRTETIRNQAKGTVDASLQLIWDERQAVTELHDVVIGIDQEECRHNRTKSQWTRC